MAERTFKPSRKVRTNSWKEKGRCHDFVSAFLEPLANMADAVYCDKILNPRKYHYMSVRFDHRPDGWVLIYEDSAPINDGENGILRILDSGESTHNLRNGEAGIGNKANASKMWPDDNGKYLIAIRGNAGIFEVTSPYCEEPDITEKDVWEYTDNAYYHYETYVKDSVMEEIPVNIKDENDIVTDQMRIDAIGEYMKLWMYAVIEFDRTDVYYNNSEKPLSACVPGKNIGSDDMKSLPFGKKGHYINFMLDGSQDGWAKSTGVSGVYLFINRRFIMRDSDFYGIASRADKAGGKVKITHNHTNELAQFLFLETYNDDGTADMEHTPVLTADKRDVVSWSRGINKVFKEAMMKDCREEFDKLYRREEKYRAPIDKVFETVTELFGSTYSKEIRLSENFGKDNNKESKKLRPDAIVTDGTINFKSRKKYLTADIVGTAKKPKVLSLVEYKPEKINADAVLQLFRCLVYFEKKYHYIPAKNFLICPDYDEEAENMLKILPAKYNIIIKTVNISE